MARRIKNKDIGKEIRAKLVRPMIVLELLQRYVEKKTLNEVGRFFDLAQEDMSDILKLSFKIGKQGVYYEAGINKKIKVDIERIMKSIKSTKLFN